MMSRKLFDMPKLTSQRIDRRLAEPRLFLQRFGKRVRDQHPKIEVGDLDIGRWLVRMLLDQSDCSRCLERRITCEHFVVHNTESVNIALLGGLVARALFR